MSEPRKIVRTVDDRMIIQLSVEELRSIIGAVIEERLRARISNGFAPGLLNAEQAAKFLGYSKDWLYKNWQTVGGKKIGKRGLRFDAAELQKWVESRKGS